jgi:GTP-binding protein
MFNRLIGKREAIVEDMPGVTRDRKYGQSDWNGLYFTVIDTGGLEPKTDNEVLQAMRRQTDLAIAEADLILFVVDGREGLLPQDAEIVQRMRREQHNFIVAVNKIDNRKQEAMLADFYALGVDEMFPISSIHGHGLGDMLDVAIERLRDMFPEEETDEPEFEPWIDEDEEDPSEEEEEIPRPRVAVLGKPNAGKSTFINHILGEERLLTMPIAGTTRDAIDVELERNGKSYLFIDTAGMRRKKYVKDPLEHIMIGRSLDALGRSDVVLMMIDATEGVSEQDAKIAGVAHNKGRALILVINKWDLMERTPTAMKEFEEELRRRLRFLHYVPVLFCSAKTGLHVGRIFNKIDEVYESYRRRVPTGELNRFFQEMMHYHPPPAHRNRPIKFYYITQGRVRPPTFMISANQPDAAHITYKRFIINSLREEFGFYGVPIKLTFRKH